MDNIKYDNKLNIELFTQNCIDGEIRNEKELKNKVISIVSIYGWEKVTSEWMVYLKNDIKDRRAAFNFATWLFIYDFGKCSINNPYPFLALLYKKLELDQEINDELDQRFDTPFDRYFDLYLDILISSKIINVNDADYIKVDEDQRLMEEIRNTHI